MRDVYAVKPETPEGEIIRAARKARRLTLAEAAKALDVSKEKLGYTERGYNDGRKRYVPDDADLSRIAAYLGIPAAELDRIGRDGAAILLRASPSAPQPEPDLRAQISELLDLLDEMFAAFVPGRPDRDVLEFLWRALDGDGNLKPPRERVRDVTNWADKDGRARRGERPSETG